MNLQRTTLAIGVTLSIAFFLIDREHFLRAYFFGWIYWTGMALGCLGILLLHQTVGGAWGLAIRRHVEAGARTLPYAALCFVPIAVSMTFFYSWARPEAAQEKAAYLNIPFFLARTLVYFLVWTLYAYKSAHLKSAPGLLLFVLTTTFAFIDWIMSLTPDWYSTIYGVMFIVGQTLSALALTIAMLILLPKEEHLETQHYHDLGNLVLAFTSLWAYLSFSQFLIIWSGNLPEEVPWYVERGQGPWRIIAILLVIFHFFVPFLLLLQRTLKRTPVLLLPVCLFLLGMRFLDTYWIVGPSLHLQFHWLDLLLPLTLGGLWLTAFFWQFSLLPVNENKGRPRETVAY